MPFQALRVIRQLQEIQFNAAAADCPQHSGAISNAPGSASNAEIGVVVDVNTVDRERLLFSADGSKYQYPGD